MKWYEIQNKRSKIVSEFIKLFINNNSFGVYRPIDLMYERYLRPNETPKFKHVSDHLFNDGLKKIKSNHNFDLDVENDSYDIIFSEIPIKMISSKEFLFEKKIKVGHEINHLAKSLLKLKPKGTLFMLYSGSLMWGVKEKKIIDSIERNGFYINSIIKCQGLWEGLAGIDLFLFSFQMKKNTDLFIGSFKENNFEKLFQNFSNNTSESIDNGKFVNRDSFVSIDKLIIEEQIENKGDYSGYPKKTIKSISCDISNVKHKGSFKQGKNSIFIPKIGNSEVVIDLNKTKLKHHNLYKVELDENIVNNEYAMYFFNTDKGKSYRESIKTGSTIKVINLKNLCDLVIFLPNLKEQEEIVKVSGGLENLIDELKILQRNLTYNPKLAKKIDADRRKFSSKLSSLTDEDKILDIISEGENKKVEFKETFGYNKHINNKIDDNLIKSSIKNIVAFLNSEGGKLLIGVNDNGEITGLDEEIKKHKSNDNFKLFFGDILSDRIGPLRNTHVNFKIHKLNSKEILIVDCQKSENNPCFYNAKEFYIRHNPKAQLLEGNELFSYTKLRFKS